MTDDKKPAASDGDNKSVAVKPATGSAAPPPKFPTYGNPLVLTVPKNKALGCEHLFTFFKRPNWGIEDTKERYGKKLDQLLDYKKEVKACQTCHDIPASLYVCLECSELNCFDCADQHAKGEEHEFSINFRNGYLWCHTCRDFVYDSDLERVRCAHDKVIAATSFRRRKRPTADEARYIENNSMPASCRATGLRGLVNFGNTCYINVVLLNLVLNPVVKNHFMTRPHDKKCDEEKYCFVCNLSEVFDRFYTDDSLSPYPPMEFIVAMSRRMPELTLGKEGDPHDFLSKLFGKLCEEFKQKEGSRCKCIMHQVFCRTDRTTKNCKSCKTKSHSDQSEVQFMMLSNLQESWLNTPVGKKRKLEKKSDNPIPSLKDLFDEHFKARLEPGLSCDSCKASGSVTRGDSIKTFPTVLNCWFPWMKIDGFSVNTIEIPASINLKEYATPVKTGKCKVDDAPDIWYDLFFTIVHHGSSAEHGHYVCYSRDRNNQWYFFNDASVFLSSEEEALNNTPMLFSYILRKLPEAE